jgi:predicted nucleotidyltransferase
VARRAGIAQSVVSIYESGRRQPSVPTLAALVEATGFELDLRVRTKPSGLAQLRGPHGRVLRRQRETVLRIAEQHGITVRGVFGSVARGEDRPDSDIDLLVDLPPRISLIRLGRVQRDLETLLKTKVDLVPEADLKPGVRDNVFAELVRI